MMISRKFPVISRGVRTALKGACAARKRLFSHRLGQTSGQKAQVWSGLDQALAHGERYGLGSIAEVETNGDVMQDVFDGPR
jgi:hypothetical protein